MSSATRRTLEVEILLLIILVKRMNIEVGTTRLRTLKYFKIIKG